MIRDDLMPIISDKFPKSEREVIDSIMKYFDRNHQVLYTAVMSNRPMFNDNDRDVIYTSVQIMEEEVMKLMKNSKTFDETRKVGANPFYVLTTLVASHCLNKKKPEVAQLAMVYMSMMMFSSLHSKYFEHNANKNAMSFAVNKMDDSFIIKKLGSVFALIEDNVKTCLDTYEKKIKRADDKDIQDVVAAIQSRLNAKIKKIARRYYTHKSSGDYLNLDSESMDADNFREISNDAYVIDKLANKVYIHLLNGKVNKETLKFVSLKSDISVNTLENLIKDIIDNDEDTELRTVILGIIEHFIYYDKQTIDMIGRGIFIDRMITSFTSNTSSEQMSIVKNTLDKWLDENSSRYGRNKYGKTARASYKKAVFSFLMYTIHIEAKA